MRATGSPRAPRTADSQAPVEEDFRYDALGNLITHGGAAQVFAHPDEAPRDHEPGATNTYDYDDSGNLVARRGSPLHVRFGRSARLRRQRAPAAATCCAWSTTPRAQRVYEKAGAIERRLPRPRPVHTTVPAEPRSAPRRSRVRRARGLHDPDERPGASRLAVAGRRSSCRRGCVALVPLAALARLPRRSRSAAGLLAGMARRPGYAAYLGRADRRRSRSRTRRCAGGGSLGDEPLHRAGCSRTRSAAGSRCSTRRAPAPPDALRAVRAGVEAGEYHAPGAASEPQQRRTFAGHAEQAGDRAPLHERALAWTRRRGCS